MRATDENGNCLISNHFIGFISHSFDSFIPCWLCWYMKIMIRRRRDMRTSNFMIISIRVALLCFSNTRDMSWRNKHQTNAALWTPTNSEYNNNINAELAEQTHNLFRDKWQMCVISEIVTRIIYFVVQRLNLASGSKTKPQKLSYRNVFIFHSLVSFDTHISHVDVNISYFQRELEENPQIPKWRDLNWII